MMNMINFEIRVFPLHQLIKRLSVIVNWSIHKQIEYGVQLSE